MSPNGAGLVLALFSRKGAAMVLDAQTAFNIVVGILISGAAWWAKEIWNAVAKLREDVHLVELSLPSNYVRKDEFSDAIKQINDKLDRISDKLDAKQDK
jgi:hypothetical protein